MSADDDDRKKGLAWLPWLVTAAMVAILAIALITSGNDSTDDSAATPPAATATAPDGTATAPAATTTTTAPATTPIPDEVRDDPVVQRLARGRSLPFTAGPWRKEGWRDAVYARLRPATRERAERVAADGGFGILIQ